MAARRCRQDFVQTLYWQMDMDLLNRMKKANEEELKRLDEELEDAEKNLGESEIRDAMMAKAEYLCLLIGDKLSRFGCPLLC
ncbi:26S proteasome non-ATPase regulatory subunit 6 [Sciurus carolinensis]|uniref:26S proteasome non-ATPase regulatory subunit 6 n=1 Tax=Sciurus carolinensis TaxID=30640 RepID=A0AA41MQ92_SCICA|nr:26S proteasome non-ATPase regulatory subunit 6 [Sciurus carolinensis]